MAVVGSNSLETLWSDVTHEVTRPKRYWTYAGQTLFSNSIHQAIHIRQEQELALTHLQE
jgi:hypothetical protein